MRRYVAPTIALALALAASGCGRAPEPVTVSRDALGTVVSITAYGREGASPAAGIETAFEVMAGVERQLDAHSPTSAVAAFNRGPYLEQPLPGATVAVLDAVRGLGVSREYSPALLGVLRLYDFEGAGRVPSQAEVETQISLARGFHTHTDTDGPVVRAHFAGLPNAYPPPPPGLDLGGAAKGLALSEARLALDDAASAALITAGSTTLTFGSKPDGEPWRIGIEDPREPGEVIATVESTGEVTVSTSGDYQRYFERDGVRYHHIIDPRTGRPAQGLRSLTVAGAASGLDSDILSTALFVMGAEKASAYCRAHGLGLYAVDDRGRTHVVPAPSNAGWRLVEQAQPKK
ncbi:MAG: hypothetical protein C0418_00310 [Coriobacteriaceae bacterium]|nr:hypothetical protein [Coriobacteriaceae bacterium]